MQGTTPRRLQGMADPLLASMVRAMGLGESPQFAARSPQVMAYVNRWLENGKHRDGAVNPSPVFPDGVAADDPVALARLIKATATELGADLVGICRLRPAMIDLGVDLPHDFVVATVVHEAYDVVIEGYAAVEEEAMRVYAEVSDIATRLAAFVRHLGYPALAHHNGGSCVQAIPVFHHAGFGELGKHGSLITEQYAAGFRPSFVTTTMPLAEDQPRSFGVQEFCLHCTICMKNCPGDAIPNEYVLTDGVKRWLTDLEKCYPYSRLRKEYCHLCVDVCPFNARPYAETYKAFMKQQRQLGYGTPKS